MDATLGHTPSFPDDGTYDELMSVLPVCLRLSLWATAAYAGQLSVDEAVARAHPDLDHVSGDVDRLSLWRDLGERAVLVALPRPGNLSGMPRGSAELIAAATAAGECVYVPSIGAALVPTIEYFGPAGDQGMGVAWSAYDCDPVPVHALEALSLSEIDQRFRQELVDQTRALEDLDAKPWAGNPFRSMADELSLGQWGLPAGMPQRAIKIITLAASVAIATELGLSDEAQSQVLTGPVEQRRHTVLTHLDASADTAMAAAATVAALSIAGLRPGRGDS
jgi:hypothetical protein